VFEAGGELLSKTQRLEVVVAEYSALLTGSSQSVSNRRPVLNEITECSWSRISLNLAQLVLVMFD